MTQAAYLPKGPAGRETGIAPSRRWLNAIELTAKLDKDGLRLLGDVVAEHAATMPDAPALLSDGQALTYGELSARINRYARLAMSAGIRPGDRVALAMPSKPEYVAAWAGITMAGGVVALINTQLRGDSLAHALGVARAGHFLVGSELADSVRDALPSGTQGAQVWISGDPGFEGLLTAISGDPVAVSERPKTSLRDPALLIYTSGTTGMPKAAHVSHHRIMSWGHWFAGLTAATPEDRLYDCLPIHHSVGGVVAIASMLVAGGSVVIAEKFSASRFWSEVVRWDCTLFQYIGELCRYLLMAPANMDERRHRLRMAIGNGLRADVWEGFQERFSIPQVLEFYAATEGNFSLFNVEGKVGSIGRIPPFLKHRFPAAIVRFDHDTGMPARGPDGLCIPVATGEAGEALGRISGDGGGRFEGYTSTEETEKKILRNVLEAGDAWFRTGDLMRVDEKGYFYFVDRIGDTFRWKGENVATAEVAAAITAVPGVADATVCGVAVPGADGRAGMAAVQVEDGFDPALLRRRLAAVLPAYAVPLFIRLRSGLEITETFKQKRADLVSEGFDPERTGDPVMIDDPAVEAYVPLTAGRLAEIRSGKARL